MYNFCAKRSDCLHININYFDNPYVDEKILNEARVSKELNINDYSHIWLGYPLMNNNEFLISSDILDKSINLEKDLDEIPDVVKDNMEIIFADRIEEVLQVALVNEGNSHVSVQN